MRGGRWLFLGLIVTVGHVGCSDDTPSCEESRTCAAGGGGGEDGVSTGTTGSGGSAPMCPVGQTVCDTACVDTNASAEHCGDCETTCGEEEVCMAGSCELSCSSDRIACDGACINPETNADFCGASGPCTGDEAGEVCSENEACVAGECLRDDATLAALTVTPGSLSPEFDAEVTAYVVSVPRFVPAVALTAEATDEDATIAIDGVEVDGGDAVEIDVAIEAMTTVDVAVTAPSGATETYEVVLVGEEATGDYIKASNTDNDDAFGTSVALDGDTLVVGAPGEDSSDDGDDDDADGAGAVYVFVREGDEWQQQAYLKAPNAGAGDAFGHSVALDGNTLAVGAPGEDGSGYGAHDDAEEDGDNGIDYGAVYVFRRQGSDWALEGYLKSLQVLGSARGAFGHSVALSGNRLAVGEPNEQTAPGGVFAPDDIPCCEFGTLEAGAVSTFSRSSSRWSDGVFIKAPNAGPGDRFGASVALNGDTLAIAAPYEDGPGFQIQAMDDFESGDGRPDSGAVYVYAWSSGEWTPQVYVKAPNADSEDSFGTSIAVSNGRLAVGALYEDSGAAGIQTELGDLLDGDDDTSGSSGAVYVFTLTDDTWVFDAYFKASTPRSSASFGAAVALDAESLLVGAVGERNGSGGVHAPDDLPGGGGPSGGGAYLYVRTSGAWQLQGFVEAEAPSATDAFGTALDVSNETVAVGAPLEDGSGAGVNDAADDEGTDTGAVSVYR
jgi:hypothetical protein